uniref:C2H2-type domain-containing protein n=1 Tax=Ditylenchus dipsaci TaxID=166011 RepID=A0A915E2M8_9BILA
MDSSSTGQVDEEEESNTMSDLAMASSQSLFGQLQASIVASSCSGSPSACTSTASPNMTNPPTQILARNSTKTLKCPKCNWHYKYQETLEIHMKEKHAEGEVNCSYCAQNQAHPKLARGESYSCGYKPYRCDLCKYSTTTKGNLSIHMQSDKHLHAMQEMPISLSTMASSPSHSHPSLLQSCSDGAGLEGSGGRALLQCLICGNFSSAELGAMLEHIELDRSRTCAGDIQAAHGFFQCNLCPYNTNLKANFQLHTRTDKHLQRVQLINHMREGMNSMASGANSSNTSALCRLAAIKSMVQVRCRACQDVFRVPFHCENTVTVLLEQHHKLAEKPCSSSSFKEEDNNNVSRSPTEASCSENSGLIPLDTSSLASNALYYRNLLWLQLICQQRIDPIDNLVYQCLCCSFQTSEVNSAKTHLPLHLESDQLLLIDTHPAASST